MGKEQRIVIENVKFLRYVKVIDINMGQELGWILTKPFKDVLRGRLKPDITFDYNRTMEQFRKGYSILPFWKDKDWYALIRPLNKPTTTMSSYVVHINTQTIIDKITPGQYNKIHKKELLAWQGAYEYTKEHIWAMKIN